MLSNLLSSIFSGFTGVGYVFNYGSSAGIFTAEGVELKPAWGFHVYIKAQNALDIERFIKVLYAKLILAEIYWKNDDGKIYTIIDRVAASRERFCFEVSPLLCDGLVRKVPDPQHIQGGVLDTEQLADLTGAELEQLASVMGVKANALVASASKQLMRLSKHDNKMLQPDTIVTLANNSQTTPKDFYASAKSHEACYATFRNDIHPSAFIAKHPKILNLVYLHDSSLDISYYCDLADASQMLNRFEKAEQTIESLSTFFTLNGVTVAYDMIKKDFDIVIPGHEFLPDNKDNAILATLLSMAAADSFKISERRMMRYLVAIGDKYHRNPVKEWIKSIPWDGQDRLQALADCLVTTPKYQKFKTIALRRWLIGCVASAFSFWGCKNEIVLVFCGLQGLEKTSFFVSLVPPNSGWIKDGLSLNPQDKDSVKMSVSYWIAELGELDATFKKSDIAALKAFLSMTTDELRLPYAATFSKYPRRTAFCASVNSPNFLVDDTGNRRFSTLELIEIKRHAIDIQQLWAQICTYYEAGEQWWYSDDEAKMQAEINVDHQVIDPLEEMLTNHYNFANKPYSGALLNPTGVLQALGIKNPSRSDATRMGNILKAKGLLKTGKKYQMPAENPGKSTFSPFQ